MAAIDGLVIIIAIVGLTPVLVMMGWVYWWLYKFCRNKELKDLAAEQHLIEKLGADPTQPIPPGRQISIPILVGGFLLGAWPFLLLGMVALGWLGVGLVGLFYILVLWYFWERTIGFCKRVEAARRKVLVQE